MRSKATLRCTRLVTSHMARYMERRARHYHKKDTLFYVITHNLLCFDIFTVQIHEQLHGNVYAEQNSCFSTLTIWSEFMLKVEHMV